jgi:hypothetical protein
MKIYESVSDLELFELGLIRTETAADVFVTAFRGALDLANESEEELEAAEIFFMKMRKDYIGAVKEHLKEKAYGPHKETLRSGGRREAGPRDAVGDGREGQARPEQTPDRPEQVPQEEEADSCLRQGLAAVDSNYLLDRGEPVGHRCKAGGQKLVVMYDGTIVPCEALKGKVEEFPIFNLGNINDTTLAEAQEKASKINFLTCYQGKEPMDPIEALQLFKEDLTNHGYGAEHLAKVEEIIGRIERGEPPPNEPSSTEPGTG